MGIENSPELSPALKVEGEPRSTLVKFYYNEETDAIERITLDSEDGETPLFPIQLEAGQNYVPNLDVFYFRKRDIPIETDSYGPSYVERFEDLEDCLEADLSANTFDNGFIRFLRDTFPNGYAQFVIEQTAVRGHIHRNQRHISKQEYFEYMGKIIMEWPDYYPGKEEYGMEYLPCSESLQYAYMLNKVLCICNDPSTYPFENEYFSYKELKEIDKAFRAAKGSPTPNELHPKQSTLAKELLEFHGYVYPGRKYSTLDHYLDMSFKLEGSLSAAELWKRELRILGNWSRKEEEE